MKTRFNLTRMLLFMKRQTFLKLNALLIAAGAIFGTLMMISVLTVYFSPQSIPNLINIYNITFFISGFIVTSRIFSELHVPQQSYAYITLPVSSLEKLAGSWLQSSVLFIILFKGICMLFYFLACLIGQKIECFAQLFTFEELRNIGLFIVLQTVFFLGAVYFRKNNFLKTILALFTVNVCVALFSLIFALIVFKGHQHSGNFTISLNDLAKPSQQVISFAFWVLLGPFMLLVSYFRLKETQV
jgi:hypothetical protein